MATRQRNGWHNQLPVTIRPELPVTINRRFEPTVSESALFGTRLLRNCAQRTLSLTELYLSDQLCSSDNVEGMRVELLGQAREWMRVWAS